jgi:hypothetical protein
MWKTGLLAHGTEGVLAGEHHGRAASAEPGIVEGSFSTDDTADGHEKTEKERRKLLAFFMA